ncbi:serine hydrolase [Bradyrhizobium manausense]|nr:serine hydrolase domain-containing protein [Bradyrhizobium manausense]MBR0833760.1 serine hydrolase [Bradyrhizobium manausense]
MSGCSASWRPLNDVVTRLVFDQLDMKRSSFIWRADFEADYAAPHDSKPASGNKRRPSKAVTASSLQTTAADYARFLQAVLSGARLKPATAKQWLEPQIRLRQHCIQCLSTDQPDADQHIAWGLGWGLEPDGGSFFHWGDNDQFKAFVIGSRADQSAVVVFTNGSNGMAIMPDVVHQLMPGDHPAFAWLNYSRHSAGHAVLDWLRAGWHQ